MGNRTARCVCNTCKKPFRNKKGLAQHRDAKNHKTKLLQQSRWAKNGERNVIDNET
jgi:hypothetical protein